MPSQLTLDAALDRVEANNMTWLKKGRPERPVKERLLIPVNYESTGCWMWIGSINTGKNQGYGMIRYKTKVHSVHRLSYELFVGPIPCGYTIDHLCRNRACVNPEHLEAVTNKENVLRGEGLPAKNSRRTNCAKGHPLTLHPNGKERYCRPCKLEQDRYYWKHGGRERRNISRRILRAKRRQ